MFLLGLIGSMFSTASFMTRRACRSRCIGPFASGRRLFSTVYLRTGSVYIHWPYCEKKCTYCDFNKYVALKVDHDRMKSCILSELKCQLKESSIEKVSSVFFGGGTPSLALPATVEAIVSSLREHLTEDAEITLEANPTSATSRSLEAFRQAGINRLSLGVQALDDKELLWLGRDHTAAESEVCLQQAAALFPGRLTADLLIGRPGQTAGSLRAELRRLLRSCHHHVALYQLTAPRGTPLGRQVARGAVRLPSADQQGALYAAAVDELAAAGLRRYEVANFALPGHEGRHNSAVWRGRQYLGVGPGAHGRIVSRATGRRQATVQIPAPERWMRAVESGSGGAAKVTPLSGADVRSELVCTALRTRRGLSRDDWLAAGGGERRWRHLYQHPEIARLQEFVEATEERLAPTARGLNVLDALLPNLLNVLTSYDCEVGEDEDRETLSGS
ncbi:radical S-adenosyl methionine domain-containing protein 1, mitochondrial-like [Amphibalanus amphitrite]|uniref:radical S-adenosyl methionine domain-containing protein 1, mitochondrial-like n=1 Tax=Amphibalanus amphitrite TaxID=1232801 RepID=UPI001C9039AD|nr:radical S-adenosyl methionine domain-containing protein 1, mitochondrial-like [Amphibalanus amphitrite]